VTPHQRLVAHLAAGAPDAEDRAHAAHCPACAALLPEGPAREDPSAKSPLPAILAAAHRELERPVRPWWVPVAGLALGNALLAGAAVAELEPWNWVASTSPRWLFVGAATVLAALITLGVVWAFSPGRDALWGGLFLAAVAPLAILVAADGNAANARFLGGTTCAFSVLAFSVLPLSGGVWLLTRSAYRPIRALAVGLASAGVGLLVLQFHCADGAPAHLAVFHLLPWAVVGAAAVLARRSLPTWSHAP
jgi:hypothetical protein